MSNSRHKIRKILCPIIPVLKKNTAVISQGDDEGNINLVTTISNLFFSVDSMKHCILLTLTRERMIGKEDPIMFFSF